MVDADIYGYSIPRMLGTDRDPVVIDEMLVPPAMWGVRCISIGYFVPEGQAVIWRGPMLMGAMQQMLTQVQWGDLDVLVIDLPPGTGDIQLTLSQKIPVSGAVIVTTPQDIALLDAQKGIEMFRMQAESQFASWAENPAPAGLFSSLLVEDKSEPV